tara:strand:+ start:117 stop:824 length:708 start_codon:yes stop_codon:yes gene_type:complete
MSWTFYVKSTVFLSFVLLVVAIKADEPHQMDALLSRFVEDLQDAIDATPRLDDCLITHAQVSEAEIGSGKYLVLSGVITEDTQRPVIEKAARGVLTSTDDWKTWRDTPDYHIFVRELVVEPKDPAQGDAFFWKGYQTLMDKLRKDRRRPAGQCDTTKYDEAYSYFSRAVRHQSREPNFANWRVLCALYRCRGDLATKLLKEMRRNGNTGRIPSRSLERIQGKVRVKYEQLIKNVR